MASFRRFKHYYILLLFFTLLSACQYFKPLTNAGAKSATPVAGIRSDVVQYAHEFTGTKYRYGGKSKRSGFDCSGFVCHVLNAYGIAVSGPSYVLEGQGKKIYPDEVQPGDLLFFRKSKGGRVFHVALVASRSNGQTKIIHATSGRGVVVDVLEESSYWSRKIITARDVISGKNWQAKKTP